MDDQVLKINFIPNSSHLDVRHLHAGALFAHEDVINVHQDVALQGHGQPLPSEEGHGVHEHQLVQPEGQVVAEQNPLDAIVEAQVLDHRRQQCGVLADGGDAVRRLGLGQQHGLIGGVVGLEDSPVVPGERTRQRLPRAGDEEQRGLWVDCAVLQTQVRVQEEGEAFQLCTQQTVFIGLVGRKKHTAREGEMKTHEKVIKKRAVQTGTYFSSIICEMRNVGATQT